jgi:hypothetical protein
MDQQKHAKWKYVHNSGGGAVYSLGLIGSIVYFLQHASSFQEGVIGVLQSFVWPAILAYRAFELLGY